MNTSNTKQVVRDMIVAVWDQGNLRALDDFWTDTAVNHSDASGQAGPAALRQYHQGFAQWMAAGLSDVRIEVVQQIAEGDRVVSHVIAHARHTGTVDGIPASGKQVKLQTIRIDRLVDRKIDEHWSVADMAGFIKQLQSQSK